MAIIDTLGGALSLAGKPDSFVDEAMNNAKSNRAEQERKRLEQAKKDADASEKYDKIISKLKVDGYDPIYNDQIKRKAGELIGILNDKYTKNKFSDPYIDPEFQKKLQDFQIFSDEAKQATKALSEDYALTTGGKKSLKPELAAALQANDFDAYQKALGGSQHYRRGQGIDTVEAPFDYVKFKGHVNEAFKPFDATVEYQDPKTGNFVTTQNQYYQNPLQATSEVLASDAKAAKFFTDQFNALPVSKQKEYSAKAQAEGGSGVAYLDYAKERLFPDEGSKSKTTIQQPSAGSNGTNKKQDVVVEQDITPTGKRIVSFSKNDVNENKELQFVIPEHKNADGTTTPEKIIYGVPQRFEQDAGQKTPVLIVSTKEKKDRAGNIIPGESVPIPYDIASPKIKTNYGFDFYNVKTGGAGLPKNIKFVDYSNQKSGTIDNTKSISNQPSKIKISVAEYNKTKNRKATTSELQKALGDKYEVIE